MVKATLGKKKIQICGNQEKRIQYIWSYLLNAFSTLVILSGGGGQAYLNFMEDTECRIV